MRSSKNTTNVHCEGFSPEAISFMVEHCKRLLHPACPELVEGFAMTESVFGTALMANYKSFKYQFINEPNTKSMFHQKSLFYICSVMMGLVSNL